MGFQHTEMHSTKSFTLTLPKSQHINVIKLTGHGNTANNNKMERINGEIRDREKTMRGLKKKDTAILKGMQVYHNYIRPHEGLEGKTPAEACVIVKRRKQVDYIDSKHEGKSEIISHSFSIIITYL